MKIWKEFDYCWECDYFLLISCSGTRKIYCCAGDNWNLETGDIKKGLPIESRPCPREVK